MQLEFNFVQEELPWYKSPFDRRYVKFGEVDISEIFQNPIIPEIPSADMEYAITPGSKYGIVLRVTDEYLKDVDNSLIHIMNTYLNNPSTSFLNQLSTIVSPCNTQDAMNLRISSKLPHDKLYSLIEGQEYPIITFSTKGVSQ